MQTLSVTVFWGRCSTLGSNFHITHGPHHEKTCFCNLQMTKDEDQPVHQCGLISLC